MEKRNVNDLTVGNTRRLILLFFVPMLMTNMLQQIYNFVDTLIVGKGLGDEALAAVGNMGSLFFFVIGFSVGLANGFGILIAQSYGAKDYETLRKNLASTIQLAAGITLLLTLLSIVFLPQALGVLNTDKVIMNDCLKYGYFIFGGLFSSILYNVSACVLRALGDSVTPLKAIVVSSVINLLLDCFLIFVVGTGVEGAAAATVISQLISSYICVRRLRRIDFLTLDRSYFTVDTKRYRLLLKNGLPMAFMNSITATGCMVVQSFVNDLGVYYTSAYSVCSKYINLFMNPACTAGQTMSSFAGQNYGAREYGRIKEGLRVCLMIAFVSYVIFGSVMVFASRELAGFMLSGAKPISLVESYLPIVGITLIFVDCLFVFRSAVQGMGYPLIPMLSGVAEMVLRISVIVLFIGRVGFNATALAETAAWAGALTINIFAFYRYLPGGCGTKTVSKYKKIYN